MRISANSCRDKIKHPTYSAAAQARRRAGLVELQIYSCGDHFHLGHRRNRQYAGRGTYYGGRRYERLIEAIDAANGR